MLLLSLIQEALEILSVVLIVVPLGGVHRVDDSTSSLMEPVKTVKVGVFFFILTTCSLREGLQEREASGVSFTRECQFCLLLEYLLLRHLFLCLVSLIDKVHVASEVYVVLGVVPSFELRKFEIG